MTMQSEMSVDKFIRAAFVAALVGTIAFVAVDGMNAAATFVMTF